MTMLFLLVAVLAAGFAARPLWRRFRARRHDPVEYFGSWDGYGLPLRLVGRISKEEAEARAIRGSAYLVGYFDADNRLVRDVKMLRGQVFFEHHYSYYPSGRLRHMTVTNARGEVLERDYREADSPAFVW